MLPRTPPHLLPLQALAWQQKGVLEDSHDFFSWMAIARITALR